MDAINNAINKALKVALFGFFAFIVLAAIIGGGEDNGEPDNMVAADSPNADYLNRILPRFYKACEAMTWGHFKSHIELVDVVNQVAGGKALVFEVKNPSPQMQRWGLIDGYKCFYVVNQDESLVKITKSPCQSLCLGEKTPYPGELMKGLPK